MSVHDLRTNTSAMPTHINYVKVMTLKITLLKILGTREMRRAEKISLWLKFFCVVSKCAWTTKENVLVIINVWFTLWIFFMCDFHVFFIMFSVQNSFWISVRFSIYVSKWCFHFFPMDNIGCSGPVFEVQKGNTF